DPPFSHRETCRRRCGAFVLLGLLLLIVSTYAQSYAQNLYCGRRECYDILGLRGQETTATTADVRRTYRTPSLQFHLDKNSSPDAAQIFQEIETAYEVLSGGLSRQAYDHARQPRVQATSKVPSSAVRIGITRRNLPHPGRTHCVLCC
ncbi:hypothetical protein H310_15286, partial [Aphanomyces invadans]